jgi:hypothetical protein
MRLPPTPGVRDDSLVRIARFHRSNAWRSACLLLVARRYHFREVLLGRDGKLPFEDLVSEAADAGGSRLFVAEAKR